ncbi:MAG: 23S rRNA (uracil(1939)-C(5))-methyltransferase RlmD [bacterium]
MVIGRSLSENERLELFVDRLVGGGDGIASWNGLKVFVRQAAPGERVRVRIIQKKKDYAVAQIEEIIEPSPLRTEPRCLFYGRCGGCQLQHIDYTGQLVIKKMLINDALQHIGRIYVPVSNIKNPGPEWHYRNKTQYPVGGDHSVKIGFFELGTHRLLDVPVCYLHPQSFNELRNRLVSILTAAQETPYDEVRHRGNIRHIIIRENYDRNVMVIVVTRTRNLSPRVIADIAALPPVIGIVHNVNLEKTNRILGNRVSVLSGQDYIVQKILNRQFRISAGSFFQVNSHQADELCRKVIAMISPQGTETVLDLFCGVGMLSLVIAEMVREVIGIEINPAAINDARFNAEFNRIKNVQFIQGDVEQLLPRIKEADTVILDPPRKGCTPETLKEILRLKPGKIVYVSCNPATLARDLTILEQNGYQCEQVEPVDMFPQTAHIETVAKLIPR